MRACPGCPMCCSMCHCSMCHLSRTFLKRRGCLASEVQGLEERELEMRLNTAKTPSPLFPPSLWAVILLLATGGCEAGNRSQRKPGDGEDMRADDRNGQRAEDDGAPTAVGGAGDLPKLLKKSGDGIMKKRRPLR